MNDPDYAETHWYPKDRSRDQNLQLYQSLKKLPNGKINKTGVNNVDKRKGLNNKPFGTFLDWTGDLPTHCIIDLTLASRFNC